MKDTTWIGLGVIVVGLLHELAVWHKALLEKHFVDFPWAALSLWSMVGIGFIVAQDREKKE